MLYITSFGEQDQLYELCENKNLYEGVFDDYDWGLLSHYIEFNDYTREWFANRNFRKLNFKEGYSLKEYQIGVLRWMRKRNGGIVALQMSMGKTLIALAHTLVGDTDNKPSLI